MNRWFVRDDELGTGGVELGISRAVRLSLRREVPQGPCYVRMEVRTVGDACSLDLDAENFERFATLVRDIHAAMHDAGPVG